MCVRVIGEVAFSVAASAPHSNVRNDINYAPESRKTSLSIALGPLFGLMTAACGSCNLITDVVISARINPVITSYFRAQQTLQIHTHAHTFTNHQKKGIRRRRRHSTDACTCDDEAMRRRRRMPHGESHLCYNNSSDERSPRHVDR